jgi:hypothetical protein
MYDILEEWMQNWWIWEQTKRTHGKNLQNELIVHFGLVHAFCRYGGDNELQISI